MSGFDDREKGFEAKYRLDEETKFRIHSRRDMLLGLWVAEQLGLTGDAAQAYARDVVAADLEKPGDDDLIEKIMTDARTRGVNLDPKALARQITVFAERAKAQIESDTR